MSWRNMVWHKSAPRPQFMQQKEWESMFQLENSDGIVIMETHWNDHTTGTLQWRATNSSEERDWEGMRMLHSLLRTGWIVKGCFWETATNKLHLWVKVKGHTNKGHLMAGVYYRCLTRGNLFMGPLLSYTGSIMFTRFSSWWGISTIQISAGKAVQLAVSQAGNSWSASRVNFRSKCYTNQWGKMH